MRNFELFHLNISRPAFIVQRELLKTQQQNTHTVVPAKSDSDVMFCLQCYQGRIIDRSRMY